jgi:hypothetical protein
MRIILSDLDGVLADSTAHACRVLWNQYGKLMTPDDVVEYDTGKVFARLYGLEYEGVNDTLQKLCWGNAMFYSFVSPYWGVWKTFLKLLIMPDTQLIFVTARAIYGAAIDALRETTRRWLDAYGFAKCEVHYFAGKPRIDWILQDRGDAEVFYIDDKAETIKDLLAQRLPVSLVQPFLLNRPWNRPRFGVYDDCEFNRISESTLPFILLGEMA